MTNSDFQPFLRALPKCEHHMHLEGALSPEVLFKLAAKNNITLPQDDSAFASPESLLARYRRFTSLDDFLHYYYIGMSALITSTDFEDLAWDYFQHASSDGVCHSEVFFDPQAHLSRGISYETVVSGFSRACKRAENELGVSSMLISCFLRHLPAKDCLSVFEQEDVQKRYADGTVQGVGLDSSELAFPPENFVDLYSRAKECGLKLTAHAGEEAPASYIATALKELKVQRIDHGIKLVEDVELMERVAKEGTMLTVCPLSNVVLRCVDTIRDVPVRKLLDKGVKFSINSDDPAYFGGYCLDNYVAVQEAFGLSVAEWESIVRAGIEGSWCGDERKGELLKCTREYKT
ncbi:adenosine deaminase [Massarina eburnea CBS 473.64]|uniref:Adenine deaminase n=1 Tax=Massarina eburnea CBS 473.64 TaxID=1395130 RepID=A0A6A6S3T6_9PLEO|nr:adenosine deaminase [Massarina eburnea CBS 473.64]